MSDAESGQRVSLFVFAHLPIPFLATQERNPLQALDFADVHDLGISLSPSGQTFSSSAAVLGSSSEVAKKPNGRERAVGYRHELARSRRLVQVVPRRLRSPWSSPIAKGETQSWEAGSRRDGKPGRQGRFREIRITPLSVSVDAIGHFRFPTSRSPSICWKVVSSSNTSAPLSLRRELTLGEAGLGVELSDSRSSRSRGYTPVRNIQLNTFRVENEDAADRGPGVQCDLNWALVMDDGTLRDSLTVDRFTSGKFELSAIGGDEQWGSTAPSSRSYQQPAVYCKEFNYEFFIGADGN
ncbi:hypothetical protein FB451DRAFT_1194780 [Mycena latifolia]|nr:hypothetical protein FB451DRAFT_1194780 [Mycena latifolia]